MRIFKIFAGLMFSFLGLILAVSELFALVDPVGTKAADDSNPFGDPHILWTQHVIFISCSLICFGLGYFLIRSSTKNSLE